MLYKYSAILNINPSEYGAVKGKMDNTALEFNSVSSSLKEMGIKEQLKFYINRNIQYSKDRDRMFELIDKL